MWGKRYTVEGSGDRKRALEKEGRCGELKGRKPRTENKNARGKPRKS
jgi:hypothetical protein